MLLRQTTNLPAWNVSNLSTSRNKRDRISKPRRFRTLLILVVVLAGGLLFVERPGRMETFKAVEANPVDRVVKPMPNLFAEPLRHFSVSSPYALPFAPANDNFANAQLLTTAGGFAASTLTATKEAGEKNHAGNAGGASVWYRWVAPSAGSYTFTTQGGTSQASNSFNTLLAIYKGSTVSNVTDVASNNDDPSDTCRADSSRVTFNVSAGDAGTTSFYIAVDGVSGASGNFFLRWGRSGSIRVVGSVGAPFNLQDGACRTLSSPGTFTNVPTGSNYSVSGASGTGGISDGSLSPLSGDVTVYFSRFPTFNLTGNVAVTSGDRNGVSIVVTPSNPALGPFTVGPTGGSTYNPATGDYELANLWTEYSYTVTASKPNYVFTGSTDNGSCPSLPCQVPANQSPGSTFRVNFQGSVIPLRILNVGSTNPNAGVNIAVNPADSNGAGDGPTPLNRSYVNNTIVTLTAIPNATQTFANWTENGTVVSSSSSYQFTITANRNLVANFNSIPNYTITVGASPVAGGTVTGNGTFASGSSRTVTANANSGYTFANWTENGNVVSSSSSYQFTLTGNRDLIASFTPIPNYTITVGASPIAGGTVTGNGTFASGSSRTVTANANSGYTFTNWTENANVVSSSSSYQFTLAGNRDLVANFTPINYSINVTASPVAGGTLTGNGMFASGSSRTVTATANSGYTFANWTENGNVVSSSSSYQFTLTGNRDLVANFTSNQPTFENVVWTRASGVTVNGNSLTKSVGIGWTNAGASSTRGIGPGGGYVEFTASENNTHRMLGLSNTDTNLGFHEIKYEIYLNANGNADPWEAGVGKQPSRPSAYQPGNRFRITVAGGIVTYSRNDEIFYTSPVAVSTYPLLVDTSLYSPGATITDVKLGGNLVNLGGGVGNQPPVANPGGPYSGAPGALIQFNGGGSSDPDGTITNYAWSFGDGTNGSGVTTAHSYATAGNYTVSLTVTDNLGATATATASVTISTGNPQVENVVWTRAMGVTVNGNSLTKSLGNGWNNAGASSTRGIGPGGGYVEFIASENNTHRMLGLSNADTNLGFHEIKYEIYLNGNGNADPWEAGVGKQPSRPSAYQPGDRFRITVAGGIVTYSKNDEVFYTSPVAVSTYPLLVDTSLYSPGATITDVKLGGNVVNVGGGVGNQPPVANPGGPYSGAPGALIQFNGGGSSDPDGTITNYAWSFGDGTNGSGVTTAHSYATAGNYTVSLTVTDNLGAMTTATANVTISTGNPQVENVVWTRAMGVTVNGNSLTKSLGNGWNNAGASSTRGIGPGGGYVEFTASENNTHRMLGLSNADTNLGFQEIKYEIYLNGNGNADPWEAGVGKQPSRPSAYQAGDRFRITVAGGIVTYSRNDEIFYTSPVAVSTYPLLVDTSLYSPGATITDVKLGGNLVNLGGGVGNQPPVANPGGPYSGAPGALIQFNGGGSSDPDGTITNYAWSFGDGTNGSGVTTAHSYATAGNYTVSLTVTDNLGATATATASVTISTGNPQVENVVWTRAMGVTVNGNSLTKSLGNGWNNAGASSTRGIGPGGGYVEFTASENNTHRMLGLSNADTNLGFQEIKYEIYLNANGNADPWEAGAGKQPSTPYQMNDRFRISVAGNVVTYSKNDVVFYTSPVAVSTYPLLVDTSLYSPGATITNVKLGGNVQNLAFATRVNQMLLAAGGRQSGKQTLAASPFRLFE